MTDNEIIKALERCKNKRCVNCPYDDVADRFAECSAILVNDALGLINRQKAEIDRLNHIRAELSKGIDIWIDIAKRETGYVELARAEAIKEFAEVLADRLGLKHECADVYINGDYIARIAEEMTERG